MALIKIDPIEKNYQSYKLSKLNDISYKKVGTRYLLFNGNITLNYSDLPWNMIDKMEIIFNAVKIVATGAVYFAKEKNAKKAAQYINDERLFAAMLS